MSNLLTLLENFGIQPCRVSVVDGGEYHSPCPGCGDGGKGRQSNRFHIWPDKENNNGRCVGRFWCRQCGASGDSIEFLMRFHNMDFMAACADLGIILDGKQFQGRRRPVTPSVPSGDRSFIPRVYPVPGAAWSEKAGALLVDCQKRLLERDDALQWLAARGISRAAAITYGLGFNESGRGADRYRPRERWGLPVKSNSKGEKKKLWIPAGWVIPMYGQDGSVHQLRIRRRDEDIEKFGANIKYLPLDGSSSGTMVLHPDAEVFAVVESGFCAILIASCFGGKVGSVTTWNSSAKPDTRATEILNRALCILNCLDADQAGAKEQDWWDDTFRRNKRWPTPVGKDPGEAFEQGVDIREWILQGLPAGLAGRIAADGEKKTEDKNEKEKILFEHAGRQEIERLETERVREVLTKNNFPPTNDLRELKSLLEHADGFFTIYDGGNGVGPRVSENWGHEHGDKRRRLSELLNSSESVGHMISNLDDGTYGAIHIRV